MGVANTGFMDDLTWTSTMTDATPDKTSSTQLQLPPRTWRCGTAAGESSMKWADLRRDPVGSSRVSSRIRCDLVKSPAGSNRISTVLTKATTSL